MFTSCLGVVVRIILLRIVEASEPGLKRKRTGVGWRLEPLATENSQSDFLKEAQEEREQAKEQAKEQTSPKHQFNAAARADQKQPQTLHRTHFNEAARGKHEPERLHTRKIAATREQDNLRKQQKERKAADRQRPGRQRWDTRVAGDAGRAFSVWSLFWLFRKSCG